MDRQATHSKLATIFSSWRKKRIDSNNKYVIRQPLVALRTYLLSRLSPALRWMQASSFPR